MEDLLIPIIGENKYHSFLVIKEYIENHYEVQQVLKEQKIKTKKWKYELKFSKGSKTFCSFYFTDHCLGFMIIFGKEERAKVEQIRNQLSNELLTLYDETQTYHDGKWFMLELENLDFFEDIKTLLAIKRKMKK